MEQEPDRGFAFVVPREEATKRIDAFLSSQVEGLTRSRVQELIRNGQVSVNDLPTKAGYRLKNGDRLTLLIPSPTPLSLEPESVEFTLVHEDPYLLVLNKPPGLVIHPAPGHATGTLVHGLLQHCRDLSGVGGILRPGIVHRLDKDTSGLMVVAKNDKAHLSLSSQFKAGMVRKRYLALVHGLPSGREGCIDLAIGRHPKRRKEMAVVPTGGRRALTLWEKVEQIGDRFTLLAVSPRTGRTHQIRVHLSHEGYPIVGDAVYGHRKGWWRKRLPHLPDGVLPVERQMLHAETLGFTHPGSLEYCEFTAPMPADMRRVVERLKWAVE